MGWKTWATLGGLGGGTVLGGAALLDTAKKAGTLRFTGSPGITSAQYLKQRGYFKDPRVVARRNMMKVGSLKEQIKHRLQKKAFTGPTAPTEAGASASLAANIRQNVSSSPTLGAQAKMTMARNAIPGIPSNSGFGKPISHLEGAPGAAVIQKVSSDLLRNALEKKAFLGIGTALSSLGSKALTGVLGKAAIGGGAAALTGGDPLTGATLGAFMPASVGGPIASGAVGAASGLLTQSRKFRNKQMGMPSQQEAEMLGQIDPSQYDPSASLPMSGLTSWWSPA